MKKKSTLALILASTLPVSLAVAQDDLTEPKISEPEVVVLSPFIVATEDDSGYYASNSITGSRISVPIQEMPLTIEVVTGKFIKDTGSTDLRSSLRYSAGVLLQTQNDAFAPPDDGSFGNVNNPEGVTANKSQSSFKIRGFVTNNTLRNAYRRQSSTDTINIERIEILRGPSALLYGVGNFGGVVNYLTKTPLDHWQEEISVSYGSDDFKRASIDITGPLPFNLGFRFTAAYEENGNYTELFNTSHYFFSPVIEWKPFTRTRLVLDFEYGKANDNAVSFLSVRTPTLEGVPIFQTDRLETYGFLEFAGKDPRTFRWSGPDTFLDTESYNGNVELFQGITDDLNLKIGYNYSFVGFDSLDVFGGIATNPSNSRAKPHVATIRARQIIDGSSTDVYVDVDNAVLQYNWSGRDEDRYWHQAKAEMNYSVKLWDDKDWLRMQHNLLAGFSLESLTTENVGYRTADSPDGENFMYQNPTDSTYLRFGQQADGTPDQPYRAYDFSGNRSENEGIYLVYSGKFLKDKLFLVGGFRQDGSVSKEGYYGVIGSRGPITIYPFSKVTKRTRQFGASFEIIEGLSVYGLKSQGVEPNFGGQRDGLGRALDSATAKSEELGIKVDLWKGRVSATFSKFKIERNGVPFSYWWAPAPARGLFRRNDAIIYRMDDFNAGTKTDNRYLQAARAEWDAAVASGAVYKKKSADGRSEYTYLNASTSQGAAYLDKVFQALNEEFAKPFSERTDLDPWTGFLYNGFDDPEVNTSAEDWSSSPTSPYYQTISDQAEGYELQLILSPLDSLQLVLNYSHVEKQIIDPGNFVAYDYASGNWDRWATWYFPNTNWGLSGVPADLVYPGGQNGLPNQDTSTWTGIGWGTGEALDDTPQHVVSGWINYTVPENILKGLTLGFGGSWESEREYASPITSSGQKKQNETGTTIKAQTEARMTLNAMVKYEWRTMDRFNTYVQLNVDNFLDDQDQYGLVYAPGLSWKINAGVTF